MAKDKQSRLAQILEQELKSKGAISGLAGALGKRTKERLDIRNLLFSGTGISSQLGRTIFGKGYSAIPKRISGKPIGSQFGGDPQTTKTLEKIAINSEISAKKSIAIPIMARDINIMKQNIVKMTNIMTKGKAISKRSEVGFRGKISEKQYFKESAFPRSSTGEEKPAPTASSGGGLTSLFSGLLGALGGVGGGILSTLGSVFSGAGFMGLLALGGIGFLIKELFRNVDFGGLGDAFGGIGQSLKKLFTNEGEGSFTENLEKNFNEFLGSVVTLKNKFLEMVQAISDQIENIKKLYDDVGGGFGILGMLLGANFAKNMISKWGAEALGSLISQGVPGGITPPAGAAKGGGGLYNVGKAAGRVVGAAARFIGPGAAVAGAGLAGYELGSVANEKFGISDKIVDFMMAGKDEQIAQELGKSPKPIPPTNIEKAETEGGAVTGYAKKRTQQSPNSVNLRAIENAMTPNTPTRQYQETPGGAVTGVITPVKPDGNGAFKNKRDFIQSMYPLAVKASQQLGGVDPNALLTQWGFESAWGSRVTGKYNYFGIKADKNWKGDTKDVMTTEYLDGEKVKLPQPFRSYDSPEDAVNDYVNFLKKNKRYEKAGVFEAKTSSEYFTALQKAGYATDPNYASKLIAATESTTQQTAKLVPSTKSTGMVIAATSTEVSDGQRMQMAAAPSSVNITNAPNTTNVSNNKTMKRDDFIDVDYMGAAYQAAIA